VCQASAFRELWTEADPGVVRWPELRESFDLATARALASMATLAEFCFPFVRLGGRLIAMKTDARAEVWGSKRTSRGHRHAPVLAQ
jgi:16S rRNA G527 N7-methylase RsmG